MSPVQSYFHSREGMISKNSHHFLRVIVALCYLTVGLSIIPVPLIVSQSFHADINC